MGHIQLLDKKPTNNNYDTVTDLSYFRVLHPVCSRVTAHVEAVGKDR